MKNAERNALLQEAIDEIANTTSLPEAQTVIRLLFGTGGDDEEYVAPQPVVVEEEVTPEEPEEDAPEEAEAEESDEGEEADDEDADEEAEEAEADARE